VDVYDLYGVRCSDLEAARSKVETALDIRFVAHESSFMGGDYYLLRNPGGESFVLRGNELEDDEEPEDLPYPDEPFLLEVNASPRSELIRDRLLAVEGIRLLRHEELGDALDSGGGPG
jgi:hypothetical protein